MNIDPVLLVSAIVSLIVLFIFFQMAMNLARLKRELTPGDSEHYFSLAQKYLFKHDKAKALDMYYEGLYLEAKELSLGGGGHNRIVELKNRFEDKIVSLGGIWPDFEIIH